MGENVDSKQKLKQKWNGKQRGWMIFSCVVAVVIVLSTIGLRHSHFFETGESHALETIRALTGNRAVDSVEDTEEIARREKLFWSTRQDYYAMQGWLILPGTMVDYPVMHTAQEDYYADHSYDGQSDVYGALFLDAENADDFSDPLSVIYGHDMRNETMFGDLPKYLQPSYFQTYADGILILESGTTSLQIVACLMMENEELRRQMKEAKNGTSWLDPLLAQAVQKRDVEVSDSDHFVAMTTLEYTEDNQEPVVLLARVVPA